MATLEQPYWERVPSVLRECIVQIGQQTFAQRFYLAGGTALALQIGHRLSVDLDFFSETDELLDESRIEIIAQLQEKFSLKVLSNSLGVVLLEIEGSHVGFFSYGYPLLDPPKFVEGIALASLVDIGLMKMDAIMGRGARKDFYDLFFLVQDMKLDAFFLRGREKYPFNRDFGLMVIEALVDFENANQQAPIETSPPVLWDDVKNFFINEVQQMGRKWFEENQ